MLERLYTTMASKHTHLISVAAAISAVSILLCSATAQLSPNFYNTTCPNLGTIVRQAMREAITLNPRVAAYILRMHFHDCFVQGCDASILLDDTANFTGEKNALPNKNSVSGYEVIDRIKSRVDSACNGIVSCADIIAIAAKEGVNLVGGPSWTVPLGRRDSRTANMTAANFELPAPFLSLPGLIAAFAAKGLTEKDMTVLSGAHTIGQARCVSFRSRIYGDSNIDPLFAAHRKLTCPKFLGDDVPAPLDTPTPAFFDNSYYGELIGKRGLLHSDQELYNGGSQDELVRNYSRNAAAFATDFAESILKMGNIGVLMGTEGEIRKNCRMLN